VLVELLRCKFGALTPGGSKYSNLRTTILSIGRLVKYLMLKDQKMLRARKLESKIELVKRTNNGMFFTLIKLTKTEQRD